MYIKQKKFLKQLWLAQKILYKQIQSPMGILLTTSGIAQQGLKHN